MFKPNNIVNASCLITEALLSDNMRSCYTELVQLGHRFYVVDQMRGRCYYRDRVITIPLWLWDSATITANLIRHLNRMPIREDKLNYRAWYLSHEMAHATNYIHHRDEADSHGPLFMNELKMICPLNAIHFELGYKPKNALAAGIMPHDF